MPDEEEEEEEEEELIVVIKTLHQILQSHYKKLDIMVTRYTTRKCRLSYALNIISIRYAKRLCGHMICP